MRVVFVGTGAGATRGSSRVKSSVLIESGSTRVLLDMGTGANMRLEDLDLLDFQALFITHLHVDHFNGLFDHLVQRKILRLGQLRVYSPPGLRDVLDAYRRAGNNIDAEVVEAPEFRVRVGDLEIRSVKACHSIYALSYVVIDGRRKVIYTGDTSEPCEGIIKEAADADLIIHEASCVKGCEAYGHTPLSALKSLFPEDRLVITHIPSWQEEEIRAEAGKLQVAQDGMEIDV